jgi:membrane glycosyltransferase
MTAEASAARPAAALPAVSMTGRRILFAVLVMSTIAALLSLMARMLAPGGLSVFDIVVLTLCAVTLPGVARGGAVVRP